MKRLLLLCVLLLLALPGYTQQPENTLAITPENADGLTEIYTLERHRQPITSLVFTEEYALNSTGLDNWWYVWNLRNGRLSTPQRNVFGNAIHDFAVEVTPDEEVITALSVRRRGNNNVVISTTTNQLTILSFPAELNDVQLTPDMETAITATQDGRVDLWEVLTGNRIIGWEFPGAPLALHFEPDGTTLTTITNNAIYTLNITDETTPEPAYVTQGGSIQQATIRDTEQGLFAGVVLDDGTPQVIDIDQGETILEANHTATAITLSSSGELAATTHEDTVRVLQIANGETLTEFSPSQTRFHQILFSPDDIWLVIAGDSGRVHAYGLPEPAGED